MVIGGGRAVLPDLARNFHSIRPEPELAPVAVGAGYSRFGGAFIPADWL